MANKENTSPEEIKTYLFRNYQYQNVLQHLVQMSDKTTKRELKCSDLVQPKSDTKQFEGKCFYCGNKATGSKIAEDANETKLMA